MKNLPIIFTITVLLFSCNRKQSDPQPQDTQTQLPSQIWDNEHGDGYVYNKTTILTGNYTIIDDSIILNNIASDPLVIYLPSNPYKFQLLESKLIGIGISGLQIKKNDYGDIHKRFSIQSNAYYIDSTDTNESGIFTGMQYDIHTIYSIKTINGIKNIHGSSLRWVKNNGKIERHQLEYYINIDNFK